MINILQTQFNKYTHPFKIDYKVEESNNVSVGIYPNSTLYTSPKSSSEKFAKLPIKDLTTIKKFSIGSLSNPMYAVLEIVVQSLQPQSASIVWSASTSDPAVELDTNKNQKKARVLIGSIRKDNKYTSLTDTSLDLNSVYVEQLVSMNLILANMLFNGVPCILPAPFAGIQV